MITQCPFLDPLDTNFYGGPPVLYDHELVITDPLVVDDPCRNTWSGSCGAGGTQGIWTFGELMSRMSGGAPPAAFVAEWLHEWEIPLVVNGFPVPPRPGIRPLVIDPWLVASGCPAGAPIVGPGACPLDLKVAPFQLNAITNRVDLECAGYLTGVKGDGEARFVFNVLDAGGNQIRASIIFEWRLPPTRNGNPYTAIDWENDWHFLSTVPIGSPVYMKVLEGILHDITVPGAFPGEPNKSAIGQVRTNELDFAGGAWKLREMRLRKHPPLGAFGLLATTTAETPDDSMNLSGPLDAYLSSNAAALANFTQPAIPAFMPGGETSAPLTTGVWNHTPLSPLAPIERHHFAFNTCNGCHRQEVNTPFLHIGSRSTGSPAPLSPFLNTSVATGGGGMPSSALTILDPAGTGAKFRYNEPWRRVCEASRMLQGGGKCWSRANGAH